MCKGKKLFSCSSRNLGMITNKENVESDKLKAWKSRRQKKFKKPNANSYLQELEIKLTTTI